MSEIPAVCGGNDTGWQNIPLNSPYNQSSSSFMKYRIINGILYLNCAVYNLTVGARNVVASLPSGVSLENTTSVASAFNGSAYLMVRGASASSAGEIWIEAKNTNEGCILVCPL